MREDRDDPLLRAMNKEFNVSREAADAMHVLSQEIIRLRSDDWLEKAAEEYVRAVSLNKGTAWEEFHHAMAMSLVGILRKHRDGK